MLKVYLGGEGANDLGTRGWRPAGNDAGVIETLLQRARPRGWRVGGAITWKSIRNYRAGNARNYPTNCETYNILRLALLAYEGACEMLVFVRDLDNDAEREQTIIEALALVKELGFAQEYCYQLAIVGGLARPNLEGWILCLLGVAGTDKMSPARVTGELAEMSVDVKSTVDYVEIAHTCALPTGEGSLSEWLADARTTFDKLIDGEAPP